MVQPDVKGVVIVCPHCGTRYQLSAEAIGSGRLVQCASCLKSWTATLPGSVSYAPPPPENDAMFDAAAEAELDAQFEAEQRRVAQIQPVRAVPPPVPAPVPSPLPAPAAKPSAAQESINKQQQRDYAQRRKSMLKGLPVDRFRRLARLIGILALAAIVGGGVAFRTEIVRQVPDLAGFYQVLELGVNVIGLEFRDVKTMRILRDGVEVLSVEARIVGVSTRNVVVPPVIITLVDGDGRAVYEWSVVPHARDLEAGEAVDFDTTLTDPPTGANSVRLTFTNGRARTDSPIALSAEPLETTN